MKINKQVKVAARPETVWSKLTDRSCFEEIIRFAGATTTRDGDRPEGPIEVGSAWTIGFQFLGLAREVKLEVMEMTALKSMRLHARSTGIEGNLHVDVVPVGTDTTRLKAAFEITGSGLVEKILLKAVAKKKPKIGQALKKRMMKFAAMTGTGDGSETA